jgi:mRNA interferase MazF
MRRGEVWWASMPEPAGSGPGYRRPVVIVQADDFNASLIQTVIVVVLTSNLRLAEAPGNVLLRRRDAKLRKNSVANVSQVFTLDRRFLTERIAALPQRIVATIEEGLRLVLAL